MLHSTTTIFKTPENFFNWILKMGEYNDKVLEEASKIEKILSNLEIDEVFTGFLTEEDSIQLKKYLKEKSIYEIKLLVGMMTREGQERKDYSLRIKKL